jgi:hypothetical protein
MCRSVVFVVSGSNSSSKELAWAPHSTQFQIVSDIVMHKIAWQTQFARDVKELSTPRITRDSFRVY